MALRKVLKEGDERLRKISRPVENFDKRLCELLDDMTETMVKADGVGLAAPQIGILRRAFIVDTGDKIVEFVNPEIISFAGSQRDIEGCLSVEGDKGYVTRPYRVKIKAQDRTGKVFTKEFEELSARAIFHENDHLDGILFVDTVEKRLTHEELLKEYKKIDDAEKQAERGNK